MKASGCARRPQQSTKKSWRRDTRVQFAEVLGADTPSPINTLSVRGYELTDDLARIPESKVAWQSFLPLLQPCRWRYVYPLAWHYFFDSTFSHGSSCEQMGAVDGATRYQPPLHHDLGVCRDQQTDRWAAAVVC